MIFLTKSIACALSMEYSIGQIFWQSAFTSIHVTPSVTKYIPVSPNRQQETCRWTQKETQQQQFLPQFLQLTPWDHQQSGFRMVLNSNYLWCNFMWTGSKFLLKLIWPFHVFDTYGRYFKNRYHQNLGIAKIGLTPKPPNLGTLLNLTAKSA